MVLRVKTLEQIKTEISSLSIKPRLSRNQFNAVLFFGGDMKGDSSYILFHKENTSKVIEILKDNDDRVSFFTIKELGKNIAIKMKDTHPFVY